jgi:hypothetical protein
MHKHTFSKCLLALSAFFVLAHPASADTINLMWDPNPEPDVIGYKVHVGTQPGTYSQHIDVGPATTWSFATAVAGQQYCFAVTAYVSASVEGPRSNEVCGYSNWPPALTNPGAQSSIVGEADYLQLAGSDPKGDVLTYNATGLPPGLAVMTSTGYISGTPTVAGTYSVTATASDGVLTASQKFTWTVTAADTTAPVVTITGPTSASTYAAAAMTLSLSGTASDSVGVTQVTWVSSGGGSGVASGTTSWAVASIALQAGSNLITVTARDAAGNTSSDTLTVTVNGAPALAAVANQSSAINLATTLQLSGSDPNNDPLTFSATGLPAGLGVSSTTGLISGTPTTAGTYNVTASVSDGKLSASRAFTWTITSVDATAPVVVISAPTSAATYKTISTSVTLSGTASDAVGVSQVTWSNNRGGSGIASGRTAWSAAIALQIGTNVLTVTGTDAAGNRGTATITVTRNSPPTLAAVSNQTNAQGQAASLQLSGADADGDVLSYGGNGLPTGLAINVSTGRISGTPTKAGTYPVTVTVSDGMQTATRSFTWTITGGDTVAPAVTITGPTTSASYTTTSSTISLRGTASDNIGVTQVSWVNSRGGSGIATGTTSWSAGISLQSGSNVLTVTARDAAGNTKTDVLTVTFNDALRITSLTANRVAPQKVGTSVTFTATAAGGDGTYEYQWRLFNGTTWVTKSNWSAGNTYVWTPTTATSSYQMRAVVRSAGKQVMSTMTFPIVP